MVEFRNELPPDIREKLSYDPDTGIFIKINSYFRSQNGRRADRQDVDGYFRICLRRRMYFAHRLAWFFVHGDLPELMIDHINGNPGDNRIQNLRLATNSENMRNRGGNVGRSLPKGVSFNTAAGRYQSSIGLNNRIHYLGLFDTVDEAFLAYAVAAFWFHRDFARVL
jgi:hypothetical protein